MVEARPKGTLLWPALLVVVVLAALFEVTISESSSIIWTVRFLLTWWLLEAWDTSPVGGETLSVGVGECSAGGLTWWALMLVACFKCLRYSLQRGFWLLWQCTLMPLRLKPSRPHPRQLIIVMGRFSSEPRSEPEPNRTEPEIRVRVRVADQNWTDNSVQRSEKFWTLWTHSERVRTWTVEIKYT